MGGRVLGKKTCPLMLLFRLLIQVALSSASGLSRSAVLLVNPPSFHDLTEGSNATALVSVQIPKETWEQQAPGEWTMGFWPVKEELSGVASVEEKVQLNKSSLHLNNQSTHYTMDTVITISATQLGKTGLRLRLVRAESWDDSDDWWTTDQNKNDMTEAEKTQTVDVWVRRNAESQRLTTYFVISVVFLIVLGNIMMGCELDLNVVLETIRRPVAPAIGLLTQFLVMPLLAFGIASTVFVPRGLYSMALGLFITGCSPGGGASNFWTLLLDGNVNLSVTMTFLSTLFSLVMMPFWVKMLGSRFLEGFSSTATIHVPYANITRSLASLVVPLLVGVAIQKWKPELAAKSKKVMRPFIIFTLIFVVVFGTISNWYMFRMMTMPALFGGLLLPWCGFMFGCFTSILLGRKPGDVTAIAIETGIQNTGIAILLLKASFGQPDADIGAVLPVIVACFTPGPLLLGAAVHLSMKAFRKRRQTSVDNVNKAMSTTASCPEMNSGMALVPSTKSLISTHKGDLAKSGVHLEV